MLKSSYCDNCGCNKCHAKSKDEEFKRLLEEFATYYGIGKKKAPSNAGVYFTKPKPRPKRKKKGTQE